MSTMNPETMTVDQLAAALGLQRTDMDDPHHWYDDTGLVVKPCDTNDPNERWVSWPKGDSLADMKKHRSEREALLRLYRLASTAPALTTTTSPIAEPAPAQAGNNVALVMRAFRTWRSTPVTGTPATDDATARAFGEMLAEAFVADAKEEGK